MEKTLDEINILLKDKNWFGYIWYVSDVNIRESDSEPSIYKGIAGEKTEIKIEGHNYIQEMYLFGGKDIAIHTKYLGDGNQRFFVNKLSDFEDETEYKIDKEKAYPSHLQKFGIEETIFQTIYKKTTTTDGSANTWEPVLEFFKGLKLKRR